MSETIILISHIDEMRMNTIT